MPAPEMEIRDVSMLRLHSEQGYGRTMQQLADNSLEHNRAFSTTLTTLSAQSNKSLIELDPMQALAYATAHTRVDPTSQVAHGSRDIILSKLIDKVGS